MRRTSRPLLVLLGLALVVAACGGESADEAAGTGSDDGSGIRLVSAEAGEAIRTDPPEGLVVLDVRTPEEFAEGHLEDAVMIDFYEEDFADQLAELDPDAPYLLYCRSGNRSSQAVEIMRELGFTDVADVDGGILAWDEAGLPIVTE